MTPATDSGKFVKNVIILAILKPCSASGKAVPTIKSSIRDGSIFVSLTNALMTVAAMSSERTTASFHLCAGVKWERKYPAITADSHM